MADFFFFVYYMKNNGKGNNERVSKFLKLNKHVLYLYAFIRHLWKRLTIIRIIFWSIIFQSINLPHSGSRLIKTISERQDLEDELILITESNKMELQMVMNFCMEGILPLPISQLEKNVPIQISRFVFYVKRLDMGKYSFIVIITIYFIH